MAAHQAQLCGGGFSPMEDHALHIAGQIDQRDLGFGRVMPMVRINSPIWHFCWPKTCSTRARTIDLAALPRECCPLSVTLGLFKMDL